MTELLTLQDLLEGNYIKEQTKHNIGILENLEELKEDIENDYSPLYLVV